MLTHTQRQCHIAMVFFLYVLFFLPLWVVLPSMTEYVIARRCLSMYGIFNNTGPVCGQDDVAKSAQQWNTWIFTACNVPSMLVVLPLGRVMDVYGRRPVMIWCLATQLAGSTGMVAVCFFELDLLWFMPPYVINGLGGGSYCLMSVFMASLTDVAFSKRQTGVLLSCAAASYYACGCLGPLVGGYISDSVGPDALVLFPTLSGWQYQFAYFLFFVTNAMLVVAAALFWRETLPAALRRKELLLSAPEAVPPRPSCGASFRDSFVGAVRSLNSRAIIVIAIVYMLVYSTVNVRELPMATQSVVAVVRAVVLHGGSGVQSGVLSRCVVVAALPSSPPPRRPVFTAGDGKHTAHRSPSLASLSALPSWIRSTWTTGPWDGSSLYPGPSAQLQLPSSFRFCFHGWSNGAAFKEDHGVEDSVVVDAVDAADGQPPRVKHFPRSSSTRPQRFLTATTEGCRMRVSLKAVAVARPACAAAGSRLPWPRCGCCAVAPPSACASFRVSRWPPTHRRSSCCAAWKGWRPYGTRRLWCCCPRWRSGTRCGDARGPQPQTGRRTTRRRRVRTCFSRVEPSLTASAMVVAAPTVVALL
jgi:MFS family permease